MAGMDKNSAVIVDWTPNPSPGTLMSNFLNEDFGSRSFSDLAAENKIEAPTLESERKKEEDCSKEVGEITVPGSGGLTFDFGLCDAQKSNTRGGLAERMAARAGFNAPKLNTSRIISGNMDLSSSEIPSPYLTIPPGLSPTTLLDSPIFLSNPTAQPSPTTGKFLFGQGFNHGLLPEVPDESKRRQLEDLTSEAFAFKPHRGSSSSYFSSAEIKNMAAIDHQQLLPSMQMTVQSENPASIQNQQDFNFRGGFSDSYERKDTTDDIKLNQRASDSFTGNEQSPPLEDRPDGEADAKREFPLVATGSLAEDGYNWRKYGQKQVKGSEFPRSYYKCTHANCQVKKKVERSHEGHITEIIYKGTHNHQKPPQNRRPGAASTHPFNEMQFDGSEHTGLQGGFEAKPLMASIHNGAGGQDWRNDGPETSSPAVTAAEFSDPPTSMQIQDVSPLDTLDAIDVSSNLSNDEDDDRATHGSASLGGGGEGDETDSKRRKLDACAVEMSAASRALREPRVVVQTTSEVDILDDGYRWRKYGQKVVKGNPNPRSYYKCTHPGCTVRKHVERASHDLKSVITTYEGKHNHEVPAARNSGGHASSLPTSTAGASTASQVHPFHGRPEFTQDSLMRFDGRAPLSSFGLPGREMLGQAPGFGFRIPQHGLTDLGIRGLNPVDPMKMAALSSVQSFMAHRQGSNGAGFAMPKGEPNEESMPNSGPPVSSSASVYQQMMCRLPLGPQL